MSWLVHALFGVPLLAVLAALWFTRGRPKPAAIAARKVGLESELEFADGSRFRSEHEIIWYIFPSGERVNYEWNCHLEREWARLERLNRWSGTENGP